MPATGAEPSCESYVIIGKMNILGIDPSLTATGLYLRETGLMVAPESTLIAPKI